MSRVHDALRRAEQSGDGGDRSRRSPARLLPGLEDLLAAVQEVPYTPAPDCFVIDPTKPRDAHSEEFRTLRTRLNHMQKLQPIRSVVVTSACPAEGKSFTAVNLALAEAQLTDNPTLLADFDFRRPVIHNVFQIDRSPGATDFLMGNAPLSAVIKRVAGTNLYLLPAGSSVLNPLEMLNLAETRALIEQLPVVFNWVLLDTPPLLFAADANLLATISDGSVLVVRIGVTTIDSVTRAMQSLCENNVLGIVANGARAGELYSKYTYYYSSYYYKEKREPKEEDAED
ncbi:MAG TPA: CpsD/CapB family tyrosine-protein kinase [Bryobacteraceae bacterium]|nr:CpsD/CapB family tyrosine-protein kinase [Bryobacteraceae bacterium]